MLYISINSFYCWVLFHLWIDHNLYIDSHLMDSQVVSTNNVVMNIHGQTIVWICAFISFGWLTRSLISGYYNRCMFYFLRNCWSVSQSGCTIWHPYQKCLKVNLCDLACDKELLVQHQSYGPLKENYKLDLTTILKFSFLIKLTEWTVIE